MGFAFNIKKYLISTYDCRDFNAIHTIHIIEEIIISCPICKSVSELCISGTYIAGTALYIQPGTIYLLQKIVKHLVFANLAILQND